MNNPPPPVPYAYPYSPYYSSHYAHAYSQIAPQLRPATTSSASSVWPTSATNKGKSPFGQLMSTWYRPGNVRCSYPGCTFYGSLKSVEIHRMDRHLIYPPDWEKSRKLDWDADLSLKGKPIPIQGTNVVLDTPELINVWIAERKTRFPTSARVEEKKRKMAEAVERGQLDLNHSRPARPPKRRRIDPKTDSADGQQSGMHARHGFMPGRKAKFSRSGWSHTKEENTVPEPLVAVQGCDNEDSGDDGAPPDVLSAKTPILVPGDKPAPPTRPKQPRLHERKRLNEPHPRGPPKNPFVSRPALLRNLILPEIRMTVSNLSQAIRFLVDNDFLRNVELKAGQAAEQLKIQVVTSQESRPNVQSSIR